MAGQFVKEADPGSPRTWTRAACCCSSETIRHTYPFCWRCDTPLLYYAKPTWYIRTTAVKDRLIAGNEQINWYPEHIKRGRFGDWLRNNIDWALTRERYWGTPLPLWQCAVVRRLRRASARGRTCASARVDPAAVDALDDLHRPYIDRIELRCAEVRRRDAAHAGGDRRLVRLRRDAVRAVALPVRERGGLSAEVPRRLHLRGGRPDARLVLHAARGGRRC